jgi:hypothetical protein
MMTRWTALRSAALLAASNALSACASQGVGAGELRAPEPDHAEGRPIGPVAFRWHSEGPSSTRGTITAVLPDGRNFAGWYQEPTSEVETYRPDWRRNEPGPSLPTYTVSEDPFFVEGLPTDHAPVLYSGRLLARLSSSDGSVMRCWFHLHQPSMGPAGGGAGTCSLPKGAVVEPASLTKPRAESPPTRRVSNVASRRGDADRRSPRAPACSMQEAVVPVGIPAVVLDDEKFPGNRP